MPEQKDLKRLVRARMEKTGESYTAARGQIVKQQLPSDQRLAELAGMGNDKVLERTGRTWRQWVRELDAMGATSMPHRDIARRVHDDYGIPGWWSQTVTTCYERIRGLRQMGQRRDTGKFDASKSRTFAFPVSGLYRAFSHRPTRERWLSGVALEVRTSIRNKSARVTWPDGTSVHLYFTPVGAKKTQLAIQHSGLADRADVAARKEYWSERFDALQEVLDASSASARS
jgi:uncharacterized protein YndB with AHSA1/START domain